jgi:rubrerythrin
MPITILDYVKSVVGDKNLYTAEDCLASSVDILGGCQGCHAVIAVYNAYPSTSGYWRCADCIGEDGFASVTDFTAHEAAITACPCCGNTGTVREIRLITAQRGQEHALECRDCGHLWRSQGPAR